MELPLLEDDLGAPGIIEPAEVIRPADVPRCLVLCFFTEVVAAIAARDGTRRVSVLKAAHGEHPVYEFAHPEGRIAVMHPGMGAPLAAAFLEEAIALGFRTVVAVGGAGALVPGLALGHPVVVESAVRDEGTSYHYLPPARTVEADKTGVVALQETLEEAGAPYLSGRTWTTDAIYRETRSRTERRVAEGCLTVEMEASAFIAVARRRKAAFAQLLYAGDSLAGPVWDERGWFKATGVRERLFGVAADACLRLDRARA
jgi:uridine phosphorylase